MAKQNFITGPDPKMDKEGIRKRRNKKPTPKPKRKRGLFLSKAARRLAEGTKTHKIQRGNQSTDKANP